MQRKIVWLLPLFVATAIVWWIAQSSPRITPNGDRASTPPLEETQEDPETEAARLAGRGATPAVTRTDEGSLPDGWIEVTARVVDEAERAVVNAETRLRVAGETLAVTQTDAEGHLRLRTPVPPGEGVLWATLHAHHETAGVAWRSVMLRPDPRWPRQQHSPLRDLGVIRLRAAVSLEVRVVCAGGFAPPATLHVARRQHGEGAYVQVLETDDDGRARIDDLHAGRWRILATCRGCGRESVFATLPRPEPGPLVIHLGPARTLRVQVVDRDTLHGVAGATVEVEEEIRHPDGAMPMPYALLGPVPPTDAEGWTTIEGLAMADVLRLAAHAPGYPLPTGRRRADAPGHADVEAEAIDAEVRVAAARKISWPIRAGDLPVPPDGTRIAIRARPNQRGAVPASGVVADGHVVVEGWAAGLAAAIAAAPDGSTAELYAEPEATTGSEITFALTRTITVSLRYDDGTPAPEIRVVGRDGGGNNLLAPVLSDEAGIATLEDIPVRSPLLELVQVYLLGDASRFGGRKIGTVDLAKGDGALEAVVGRDRDVIVRVSVDGKPELPKLAWIQIGSLTIDKVERDEARAAWRFTWRPPLATMKTIWTVAAYGCVHREGWQTLEVAPGSGPIEVDLDLVRAGTLLGTITQPKDGKHQISLEVWDPTDGVWYANRGGRLGVVQPKQANENGQIRFAPLASGRYRLRDGYTRASSAEVEVRGGETTEVTFDLSVSFAVSGRVEAAAHPTPTHFAVRVAGLPADAPDGRPIGAPMPRTEHVVTCREDGSFRVRLPGPGPWTLVPEGLLLRPAPKGGTVSVEGPAEGVVLRLVEASTASVHFEGDPAWPRNPSPGSSVRVLLFRGKPCGEPDRECRGWRKGNTLTFSGFAPGTWTVWIDAKPYAPTVLEGVTLQEGENDLGGVTPSEGAVLRLRILLPEGQVLSSNAVWAMTTEAPLYTRIVSFVGSARPIVLRGLGRGRFRIVVTGTRFDETIEIVSGNEDLEREIDLR